jgi:hypothetical protein
VLTSRFCILALLIMTAATGTSFAANVGLGALRGEIDDSVTQRPVPGATVRLMHGSEARGSVQSDANGQFELNDVPEGVYSVEVEGSQYLKAVRPGVRITLNKTAVVEFNLVRSTSGSLEEVVVSARAANRDPYATPNTVTLDREEIRRNPGSLSDVFRALDMLPGVISTGEFSSFTVRGNGPRDNLITVDGIPFDKVVHFDQGIGEEEDVTGGGRFSIFAPNLIGASRFSPGAWRASEDGKFGSLLQLEIAKGNTTSSTVATQFDFGGLEASYEGPSYLSDNTSVLMSARSFDFSTLLEAVDENDVGIPKLTDLVFKSVTELGLAHEVELLAIRATETYSRGAEHVLVSENFEDVSLAESEQTSDLLGLTWRWSAGESIQLRNAVYFRDSDKTSSQGEAYPDIAGPDPQAEDIPLRPDILSLAEKETEYGWRGDLTAVLGSGATISAGGRVSRTEIEFGRSLSGDWIRYTYDASDDRPDPSQRYIVLTPEGVNSQLLAEELRYAAYTDYSHPFGSVTVTPGLRFERDGFSQTSLLSPRLHATWRITDAAQLWLGSGVYHQAPSYLDLSADPANARLEPERSTQVSVGYSLDLSRDLRFTTEAYHQRLSRLLVFDDRTTQIATNTGKGTTSGLDLTLNRRMSKGWSALATYSYSRARRDDRLGEGEYASDFDRPHAFGLLAVWEPSDRWSFSAKWRYAAGVPADDFIVHNDVLAGASVPYLPRHSRESTLNNVQRLPAFHSLTLRADYHRRFGPLNIIAFIDFVNVYGRKNGDALEWDERRGVNILEGLDEPFAFLGMKIEHPRGTR